jgi:ABC-type microcin C transport system permease subunit YejE
MIKTLKLSLEALKSVEFVGKKMDGGNPKLDEAIEKIKSALKTRDYEWQGLTEEEFVYFCSYVNHDILSQIENILRDKNELRCN